MEVYGLTGGIGSGKSTVANMLEDYGIPVVSADELSRMVVAPGSDGLADVVAAFGAAVLDDRGELDRKKMGQIVLERPDGRRQLESILHPRIRERYEQVLDALEKADHPVMVYEVPLLFEKKLDQQDEMRAVILVSAAADTRIARLKARDSLTTDDVIARMRSQMPEEDKRARADYIIYNDGGLDDLRVEVEQLLSHFLRIPARSDQVERSSGEQGIEELDDLDELEELDEVEELEVVEESEIDTVGPEDAAAPAPSEQAAAPEPAAPAPSAPEAAAPPASAAPDKPKLEVELHPTAPHPVVPKAAAGAAAGATPSTSAPASTSGAAWIPAGGSGPSSPGPAAPSPPTVASPPTVGSPPTVASPPAVASPAPPAVSAPAPRQRQPSGRARSATVPQMEVPDVTAALAKELLAQKKSGGDEEPSS